MNNYYSGGFIPNNTGEPIKLLDCNIDYIHKKAIEKYGIDLLETLNNPKNLPIIIQSRQYGKTAITIEIFKDN